VHPAAPLRGPLRHPLGRAAARRRFADAHRQRARAESLLRYSLFVDCMPTDDLPGLTSEQVSRILRSALNSRRLRDRLMETSQLITEANTDYARAMNRVLLGDMIR
jgi:dynein heavy chain